MDPTTRMAQIASVSQVEQAIGTNARLDALLTSSALATCAAFGLAEGSDAYAVIKASDVMVGVD